MSLIGKIPFVMFVSQNNLIFFFLLLLGLVVGSFLGCLTWRFPKMIDLWGRSSCPGCKTKIRWQDNIPIFSYFLLGGKCKSCKRKISLRYPIIEGITGLVFLTFGWVYLSGGSYGILGALVKYKEWLGVFTLPYLLFITAGLLAIAVVDFEYQLIPDKILFPILAFNILILIFLSPSPFLFTHFAWATFAALFFFLLHILTRGRGMGLGDVKLSFFLGLLLGFPETPVAIFLSFLAGAAVGIILIFGGRARFGNPIPFGPFLVLGSFTALVMGRSIWQW